LRAFNAAFFRGENNERAFALKRTTRIAAPKKGTLEEESCFGRRDVDALLSIFFFFFVRR